MLATPPLPRGSGRDDENDGVIIIDEEARGGIPQIGRRGDVGDEGGSGGDVGSSGSDSGGGGSGGLGALRAALSDNGDGGGGCGRQLALLLAFTVLHNFKPSEPFLVQMYRLHGTAVFPNSMFSQLLLQLNSLISSIFE